MPSARLTGTLAEACSRAAAHPARRERITSGGAIFNVTVILTLLISLVSLLISIIALRFTQEQARSYLFPVPTIYMDPDQQSVVLRNFGSGAMLSVSSEIKVSQPGLDQLNLVRYHPSLAQGEKAVLLSADVVSTSAIVLVEATVSFENIRREQRKANFRLTSDQLGTSAY